MAHLRPGRRAGSRPVTRVRELDFPHPVVVIAGVGHWGHVRAASHEPLTGEGIASFVRWTDTLGATRFAFVVSRWAADGDDGPAATALAYAVDPDGEARPPSGHPSHDDRFTQVAEIEIAASPAMLRHAQPAVPVEELLWGRPAAGGPLMPVHAYDSAHGYSRVTVLAAGSLPAGLFVSRPGVAAEVAAAATPVAVDLHTYTRRTLERVARRAAAGRGRPAAQALVGTPARFEEDTP